MCRKGLVSEPRNLLNSRNAEQASLRVRKPQPSGTSANDSFPFARQAHNLRGRTFPFGMVFRERASLPTTRPRLDFRPISA